MTIDYTRLRELAEAATGGPWVADGRDVKQAMRNGYALYVAENLDHRGDAAYIAAANPATVLALLDRIAELEAGETRTEWRVLNKSWLCTDNETWARDYLTLCHKDGNPDARLERRTVTTGAWEVAE